MRSDAGAEQRARHPRNRPSTTEARAGVRAGLAARWFAWLLSHGEGFDRDLYGERKRALLGGLSGTVVEIGPGAGVNLPYYAAGVRWIGVEPNVHFHERLRRAAERHGIEADVLGGVAEHLPVPDASADAVVSTLVLCSVTDLDAALAEVRRVLKPGGRFVFVEHVAAPEGSLLRRVQRIVKPAWGVIADGCRPDRETGHVIERAGFADVQIERFDAAMPLPVVRPHIAGTARRAG
ncbi:MAG: class I SAM-dependent methyltransferase [Rhodothermales bacterium]